MRLRGPASALVAVGAFAVSAASAGAADPVVANHPAVSISALDGNLIYQRKVQGKYVCMRRVGGKVSRATPVPGNLCGFSDLGLDRTGRVVYPYPVFRMKQGTRVSARWFLYDLKSDRARRVKGLPGGACVVETLLVWRKRMVYGASCPSKERRGLWVKDGRKTRRIASSTSAVLDLTLRGGALAAVAYTGPLDDSEGIVQLMVGGKPCVKLIKTSVAPGDYDWAPSGVWIANGRIVWSMGNNEYDHSLEALLASKLPSHCAAPGPTGRFDFTPETTTFRTLAVDGRQAYYGDAASIRSHTLPEPPSHAPPPNDNFENAQSVEVDGAVGASGRTAWATVQPGEPLTSATQSVWYTFTPATSGTLYVSAYARGGDFGVYEGTGLGALTPVAGPSSMYYAYITVDVVAGQQYWIDVGTSDTEPDYAPFGVRVASEPPHG